MGLIPLENVNSIKVHSFIPVSNGINYLIEGPTCYANPAPIFNSTKEISIKDIILVNGERVPPYQDSQKDFKVSFVIVVPYGETINKSHIDLVKYYRDNLPEAWSKATSSRSTISYN